MRRTIGLVVLAAALGSAPACLAQQQPSYPQQDNGAVLQGPYLDPPPLAKFVPAQGYARGVEALKAKRYKEAVRTLARVADAAPGRPAVWRVLGAAYAGEQRWDASRRAYRRAIYLAPDDVLSHAGLAVALVALNDPRAEKQAAWLKARAQACGDTCPDAPVLKALETSGPFAGPSSS